LAKRGNGQALRGHVNKLLISAHQARQIINAAASKVAKLCVGQASSIGIEKRPGDLRDDQTVGLCTLALPSGRKEAIVVWAMSGKESNDGGGIGSRSCWRG